MRGRKSSPSPWRSALPKGLAPPEAALRPRLSSPTGMDIAHLAGSLQTRRSPQTGKPLVSKPPHQHPPGEEGRPAPARALSRRRAWCSRTPEARPTITSTLRSRTSGPVQGYTACPRLTNTVSGKPVTSSSREASPKLGPSPINCYSLFSHLTIAGTKLGLTACPEKKKKRVGVSTVAHQVKNPTQCPCGHGSIPGLAPWTTDPALP